MEVAARRSTPSVAAWSPRVAAVTVAVGVALGLGAGLVVLALDDSRAVTAASGLLVDAILLAVVFAVAHRGAQRFRPSTLGIRRTAFWSALGWVFALLVLVWVGEAIVNLVVGGLVGQHGSGSHAAGRFGTGVGVLLVAATAVSAPIAEEIAFRGYLYPALAGWRGPWVGAAFTAILFACAHVLALPPAFLPGIAVFGFGACLLRWFTGSLLPGITLHSLNNAIVLAALSKGQLLWAIPVAPLLCLALLAPFARTRAEDVEAAVATTD
jgi:uncharacterized protein